MNKSFTASEVRELAVTMGAINLPTTRDMLRAYADRLEADEKVQAQAQNDDPIPLEVEYARACVKAAQRHDRTTGVCAIGADASNGIKRSVSQLAAPDQAVQTRATPSIFDMAEQCGAEIDGGEYPDTQTGFPGEPPSITFTEGQLEKFVVMFTATPHPDPADAERLAEALRAFPEDPNPFTYRRCYANARAALANLSAQAQPPAASALLPFSVEQFRQALMDTGVVKREAIDDPVNYDSQLTLDNTGSCYCMLQMLAAQENPNG